MSTLSYDNQSRIIPKRQRLSDLAPQPTGFGNSIQVTAKKINQNTRRDEKKKPHEVGALTRGEDERIIRKIKNSPMTRLDKRIGRKKRGRFRQRMKKPKSEFSQSGTKSEKGKDARPCQTVHPVVLHQPKTEAGIGKQTDQSARKG